jgi:hypothetical protein
MYTISVDPRPSTCCGQAILRSQRRRILRHAPHHLRASFRSTSRSVIYTQHDAFVHWNAAGAWKIEGHSRFIRTGVRSRRVTSSLSLPAWWKAQDGADRSRACRRAQPGCQDRLPHPSARGRCPRGPGSGGCSGRGSPGVPAATTGAPGSTGVGAFVPLDERTGPPCQGTSRQPRSGWVIPPGTPCRTLAAQGARAAGLRSCDRADAGAGRGGTQRLRQGRVAGHHYAAMA